MPGIHRWALGSRALNCVNSVSSSLIRFSRASTTRASTPLAARHLSTRIPIGPLVSPAIKTMSYLPLFSSRLSTLRPARSKNSR